MSSIQRIIVDVDVGTDDFMSLILLLYKEKIGQIKIEAILCSAGNTTLENVCKNVVRLLEFENRTDIPVYKGASGPLIPPKSPLAQFHGIDGLGDLYHTTEPDVSIISKTPSAIALRDIVIKNPKEISLLFLGPLTNLALSIKIFDDLIPNVKQLWIMGGNYQGVGNTTPYAEYNFFSDPEAASIVLDSITCPIFLLPWESCLKPNIPLEWRLNLKEKSTDAFKLLTEAEEKIYKFHNYKEWMPCDAFVTFALFEPERNIIEHSLKYLTVELEGEYRGKCTEDPTKPPKIVLIESIDIERFKELVVNAGCLKTI